MSLGLPSDYYIKQMNEALSGLNNPKILLHSCCAPCSSFCLLALKEVASLGVYYYNPNISFKDEWEFRFSELKRLVDIYNSNPDIKLEKENQHVNITKNYVNSNIEILDAPYESELFFEKTKGYEKCPERGERCAICFDLRLRKTALKAKELGYDFFATTLTLSPLKDANLINQTGERIAKEVGISYLPSDFKKKNGYKMSIELSKEFNLYRQNYCGCIFSKK
ncbi:MAG: epoxyqueuosine reductase QueH [Lachnospiraceae bacterium]|nr:epoxyqueuosine reductase QueH [Lachnospiraceae bacterium]